MPSDSDGRWLARDRLWQQIDWLHSSLVAQGAPRGTLALPGFSSPAEKEILELEAVAHLPKEVREMIAAAMPKEETPPTALELRVQGHKALRCTLTPALALALALALTLALTLALALALTLTLALTLPRTLTLSTRRCAARPSSISSHPRPPASPPPKT